MLPSLISFYLPSSQMKINNKASIMFYVNVKLIHVLVYVSRGDTFCHMRFHISFTISQKLVTDKVSQLTQQGEKQTPFLSHLKHCLRQIHVKISQCFHMSYPLVRKEQWLPRSPIIVKYLWQLSKHTLNNSVLTIMSELTMPATAIEKEMCYF